MLEKTLKLTRLLDLYGDTLTDKQKEAMDLYYNCDMSLSEVGEELGVSRQGVRDTLTRATATLLELEEKIGYFKTLSELKKDILKAMECKDYSAIVKIADDIEV